MSETGVRVVILNEWRDDIMIAFLLLFSWTFIFGY